VAGVVPAAASDGQSCAAIAADRERLACYDRAHGRRADAETVLPTAPAVPRSAAVDAVAVPVEPVPPVPASPAPQPQRAVAPSADEFGKAAVPVAPPPPAEREPDRIQARLAGPIEGLALGQELLLDNGQRWVVIDDRALDMVADRPKVTLWRNLIGSYWLRFEPRGPQLRVRRVK